MVSGWTGLAAVPRTTPSQVGSAADPSTRASLLERRIAVSGGISASAARRAGAGQLRQFPACLVTGFTQTHRRFSNFPERVLEG